jgi:hypothetical protein
MKSFLKTSRFLRQGLCPKLGGCFVLIESQVRLAGQG